MGPRNHYGLEGVTVSNDSKGLPDRKEIEITLLGPGYGESVVLHIGGGKWVIVDSCVDTEGTPRPLHYLDSVGVDPSEAVVMVIATHWHDDHIRGMSTVVETCRSAKFCCAAALRREEFLTVVNAWGCRPPTRASSGVKEIYGVISHLWDQGTEPMFTLANRRIYAEESCEIWSLSPDDKFFGRFLRSIDGLLSSHGQTKTRVPEPQANDIAIALWISAGNETLLLGSDLERPGWVEVLNSNERPMTKASAFKIPHHGSKNADHPGVWEQMLVRHPIAILTPWRRGHRTLPSKDDARRILSHTSDAYLTARNLSTTQPKRRNRAVARTVRESNIQLRRHPMSSGALQLRRASDSSGQWSIQMFGPACHLRDYAA